MEKHLRGFIPLVVLIAIVQVVVACGEAATATPSPEPAPSPTATAIPTPTQTPAPILRALQEVFAESSETMGPGDATPPLSALNRPAGSFGFSHYVFEEIGGSVVTTLVEGPRGEQVRVPLSYMDLKEMYEQGGPPPQDLRISREELGELVRQLDTVREATEKYRDVEVARAEGYFQLGGDVPNMGAHFTSPERVLDGVFDPSEPEILLYSQDATGDWELVGTAFILLVPQIGQDHPEGFPGPLDNWHVHYNLCRFPRGTFKSATAVDCKAQGGSWIESLGWMMHAYVWVDNPLGVFQMWNPNIRPVVTANDIREARAIATRQEGEAVLSIENFSHREAEVKVGGTVVWTNLDGVPHTVTSGSQGVAEEGFDSGNIVPGQSFVLRFDQPGKYSYTCTLHPSMNGVIVVAE